MSQFLFLSRSGHDHRTLPYDILGGVILPADQLWPFNEAVRELEEATFGERLRNFGTFVKGQRLLDHNRYQWAQQGELLDGRARRKHALAFLEKGRGKGRPDRLEFTAYGQACLHMAHGMFQQMRNHHARIVASIVPKGVRPPPGYRYGERLRRDQVLLMERFFHFLEQKRTTGILVLDRRDQAGGLEFARNLERYFNETRSGRFRSEWIVPAPMFVSAAENYPLQAADLAVYCLNHGFRLPRIGMDAAVKMEIARDFGPVISNLQYYGELMRGGEIMKTKGIVFVLDPYSQDPRGGAHPAGYPGKE